jgi:gp16 family phage-associated protein
VKTREQVKKSLRRQGIAITEWALEHDVHPQVVRDLLDGKLQGHRGQAHRAAVLLGIKDGELPKPKRGDAPKGRRS